MITAQDIREKTFERARFNGYDTGEVDDFLEEMAADLAASQKEAGVLKGKMKILVDKIEEYRATEEAMNKALVSAQTIARDIENDSQVKADAILAEAQEKADAIIAEAQAKADAVTGDLVARREEEETRLAAATSAAAEYIEKMLLVCQKQNDFLTALKEMDLSAHSAVVTPAPGEKKAIPQPDFDEGEPESEPEAETAEPEYVQAFESAVYGDEPEEAGLETESPVAEEDDYPEEGVQQQIEGIPGADEDVDEPTRMFRF